MTSQIKLDSTILSKKENNHNGSISIAPTNNGMLNETNNNAFTKLYVDVHEPKEIVEMLKTEKGIYVEVVPLECGDYCWGNRAILTTKTEVLTEFEQLLYKRLQLCPFKGIHKCLLKERMKQLLSLKIEKEHIIEVKERNLLGRKGKPITCESGGRNIRVTVKEKLEEGTEKEQLKNLVVKNGKEEDENTKKDSIQKGSKSFTVLKEMPVKNVDFQIRELSKFITWMKLDPEIETKVGLLLCPKRIGIDCNSCAQTVTELHTLLTISEAFPLKEFIPSVLVERKTLNDFYNSIVHGDKHIWKQVFNLKKASERPMLIIERWDDSFISSRKMEQTIRGAIASIFLMGVSVLVIPSKGQNIRPFVDQLSYLFFSSDKKALSIRPVSEKRKLGKKKDYLSDLLSMVPNIGRRSADAISARINSLEELCQMSDEELKKICPKLRTNGINSLRWLLNGKELEAKESKP